MYNSKMAKNLKGEENKKSRLKKQAGFGIRFRP